MRAGRNVILCGSLCAAALGQPYPDFSGKWILDKTRTAGEAPWGQTHAESMEIAQNGNELTMTIKTGSFRFILDGAAHAVLDRSMGDLPDFVRKTETVAVRDGNTLTLRVTELAEQTDRQTGIVSVHPGITDVHTLRLSDNGNQLIDERTGYRAKPPGALHGRPYKQSEDYAYRRQTAVFVRRQR